MWCQGVRHFILILITLIRIPLQLLGIPSAWCNPSLFSLVTFILQWQSPLKGGRVERDANAQPCEETFGRCVRHVRHGDAKSCACLSPTTIQSGNTSSLHKCFVHQMSDSTNNPFLKLLRKFPHHILQYNCFLCDCVCVSHE